MTDQISVQDQDQEQEQTQDQDNMFCPICEKFQPKAERCSECDVIIEKALHPSYIPKTQTAQAKKSGVSLRTLLLFLLFTTTVLYYLFDGSA